MTEHTELATERNQISEEQILEIQKKSQNDALVAQIETIQSVIDGLPDSEYEIAVLVEDKFTNLIEKELSTCENDIETHTVLLGLSLAVLKVSVQELDEA